MKKKKSRNCVSMPLERADEFELVKKDDAKSSAVRAKFFRSTCLNSSGLKNDANVLIAS